MKKIIYVVSFIILGILLQFLAHMLVEIWYIGLLIKNFELYGFGFSWDTWLVIHHVAATLLFFAGAVLGFWQGKFWWRKIYER